MGLSLPEIRRPLWRLLLQVPRGVRGHWGVENSLHWVLDDTFQEDRGRLRTGHAARNMAALRRIALNFLTILKQYFWPKLSIRRLRKMVARTPGADHGPVTTLSMPWGRTRPDDRPCHYIPQKLFTPLTMEIINLLYRFQ